MKRLGREQRHCGVEMRSHIIHRTRPINPNLSSLEQDNALTTLRSLSTTGSSEAMRQQMLDDTFVLADIALLGNHSNKKEFLMSISTIKNLSSKISSEFSKMKSSKSLEDKLSILGNMISLVSKQNEELADQISKSTK